MAAPFVHRQRGLSLVELMVSMVIGLITTLVITQVFSTFEADKRTTTNAADAQTNGSVALYMIKRQAALAGFGLPTFSAKNPPLLCSDKTLSLGGVPMFPIEIVDGGDGASDTVNIRYGSSSGGGIPIIAISSTNPVGVNNNLGCQNGDAVLLANQNHSCKMTQVSAAPTDTTHISLASTTGFTLTANDTQLACMGSWSNFAYQVSGGQLQLATTTNSVTTTAPVVDGIVNIQAQYGVSDAATSNIITAWVDATGSWASPDVAVRNRIKAIRIAVVARSGFYENTSVTDSCSSLTSASPTGLCAWEGSDASPAPSIDLSADSGWQHYRYRVYESIIPLRNIIWTRGNMA